MWREELCEFGDSGDIFTPEIAINVLMVKFPSGKITPKISFLVYPRFKCFTLNIGFFSNLK
jgi:hypothetical protein